MPTGRPRIPSDIARQIFIDAGHRCACCGAAFPLERAHIVPWRESRDHSEENLICLCANCHEMADRDWDRRTFYEYKRRPWVNRQGASGARPEVESASQAQVEELVAILEDRALRITAELASQYQTDVRRCLADFLQLHKEHISALRAGQLIRAHEAPERVNEVETVPVRI